MNIGDTITVSYEESKKLRKEGWKPRNDVVTMMYVGKPDSAVSNRSLSGRPEMENPTYDAMRMRKNKGKRWTQKDHDFANRKLAEAACS